MNRPLGVALFFLLLASPTIAQESNAPAFGKGLFNLVGKDSSWTMKIGARMQFLTLNEWTENNGSGFADPSSNFLIRRSRLKFDGYALDPKFEYKIELGLSNRDMSGASPFTRNSPRFIMDAVVKWNFHGNFVLWAGQTKLPGNIERVISSGNLQLVDRSLLNSRFNIDRDIGFQLRHHHYLSGKFLVREIVAFSQGEGRNVTEGNLGGHQYTARLEVLPMGAFTKKGEYSGADLDRETEPKLFLAATYDYNDDAVRTRSNLGSYMFTTDGLYETPIQTVFVDAMFKYRGFSVMGEYASRSADDPLARNSDGTLTGDIVEVGKAINLQSGYLFKSNWEVAGRYTHLNLDAVTGRGNQTQYTLGLSRYIVGHKLKVQTDFSYLDFAGNANELMWRLQMDLHF
ncbi:porin [Robiginitalea sp. M366]|uniref:porin n=1 Tax=Robiginitalea aestuariiviva TaxID=3036903 RepID=UPI00240E930D|nr:porin [Robiginitalea aestuariiviva]MDG1571310.1 porin [Robiginitalea aestuariiviva]